MKEENWCKVEKKEGGSGSWKELSKESSDCGVSIEVTVRLSWDNKVVRKIKINSIIQLEKIVDAIKKIKGDKTTACGDVLKWSVGVKV